MKDVIIQNCKTLLVTEGTFNGVSYIGHIQFKNIEDLILEPNSLKFKRQLPSLKMNLAFYKVSH